MKKGDRIEVLIWTTPAMKDLSMGQWRDPPQRSSWVGAEVIEVCGERAAAEASMGDGQDVTVTISTRDRRTDGVALAEWRVVLPTEGTE